MTDNDPKIPSPQHNTLLLILSLISVFVGIVVASVWLRRALAEKVFDQPPLPAFVGILLAVAGLTVGLHVLRRAPEVEDWRDRGWLRFFGRNGRSLMVAAAILLTIFVLWRLPQTPAVDSHALLFWAWLAALVLYVAAFLPRFPWRWHNHLWLRENWQIGLLAAGLGAAALLLRLWRLETIPFALSGDEASQGLEAVRILAGELRNPFTTGWLGVPTMSFFFNSWSIAWLGQTAFALRLPWALVGAVTVVVVFFLVKRLVGWRLGLATAVILAVYHYHIHFSRLGTNQIADPFFMALALLFLYRALDKNSYFDWTMVGVVCALALYFYAGARLTAVVILAVLGYEFIRQPRRFFRERGRGLLVALGAFLLVGAPIIQYALRFPQDFNARLNQVGILQNGWLQKVMVVEGTGPVPVLWEQFIRAALAFNFYPDRTIWYGLREPLLKPVWGVLFLVGLGYAMLRLVGRGANPRYAPLVIWWWAGMLLGGFLTENPPSSQRLVTLAVPVTFFLALALWQIIRLLLGLFAGKSYSRSLANGLLAVGVLLFALSSFKTYFAEYTPLRIYGGPNSEMATTIAPRLRELRFDHDFYFVGPPHMYWGFATLPYLVPGARGYDVAQPLVSVADAETISLFSPDRGAVFIFHDQRIPTLTYVEAVYPGGRRENFYSEADGRLMTILYVLEPRYGR